ncbi:hypothetical protein P4N68_00060 [Corynebacterium felinum]|uniref:Uncharacterized protein n=2 Tax=Corynebacterium TaxID=1716 RepID=A0ABU2B7C9_9CORY|nr:hypothetical protein [Corynebacterium felinum]MDF5819478.1 hypothetical protein [Corynebacterium felinum]MDR7354512.1 hypothetical protein [Corynebacterium felinum]
MSRQEWEFLDSSEKEKQHCMMVRELVENDLQPVFADHDIEFEWDGEIAGAMLIKNCDYFAPVR